MRRVVDFCVCVRFFFVLGEKEGDRDGTWI